MSSHIPFVEAEKKIRAIRKNGNVEFSDHCLNDSMPNRGITLFDVFSVLDNGHVISAEWNNLHSNWKYRIEGADIEGEELTDITVIIEEQYSLLIITVY